MTFSINFKVNLRREGRGRVGSGVRTDNQDDEDWIRRLVSPDIDTEIHLVIIVIGWAQSVNEALLCVKPRPRLH